MAAQKHIAYDSAEDPILPALSSKYPWFVAQNLEEKDGDQIFFTIHDPLSNYRCRIPELSGRQIRGCFHGWVILTDHPDMVMWSLWNPITSRMILLPPLMAHEEGDSYDCCLSSPPNDPGSFFLLTVTKKPIIFFCRLDCETKKLRWTKMSYAEQLNQLKSKHEEDDEDDENYGFLVENGFLECLTHCNGKVYALTMGLYYRFVIRVDIVVKDDDEQVSFLAFMEVPKPPSFDSERTKVAYMKAFSTQLLFIETSFDDETRKTINDVFLLKLDMTNMRWEEMKDLKAGAIFASHDSVIYTPEIASMFGGHIHFLGEMGKEIYSYSVRNKTIFLSSMPTVLQTRQVLSAWTMFECNRLPGDDQQGEDTEGKKEVRSVGSDSVDLYSTTGESHLLDIPCDVLQRIMELCVGVDCMNFRATCKCCCLAAPLTDVWKKNTALKRLWTYSLVSPWLVVFDEHQGIISFTDPVFGNNYFITTPEELMDDFQISCSRKGWLLMFKDGGTILFYNPFTSNIRRLPQAPVHLKGFCFNEPPTSPICIVAGFMKSFIFEVYIYLIDCELEWTSIALDFLDPYSFHFPTFPDKDLYGLSDNGGIHAVRNFTYGYGSWEVIVAEPPTSSCKTPVKRFLAKWGRHYIQVVVSVFGESVELFKLNDSKKEWEKIDGLGKHMVYICGTTCLCVEARTPEMENKIYFPILRSKKIVLFSLETCGYHTFNGKNIEESFADFFQTEYHTNSHAWIEPSWF